MRNLISLFEIEIMFDSSIIMAIIAINMTVIGLTSLADRKTVIGIDYEEFMIKDFKIFGITTYYWLINFALINVISLFTIFIENESFRIVNFVCLTCSLMFAIYYFFRFILVENTRVIKQIYMRELLGLYRNSKDKNHHESDVLVRMNSGTRTSKKMSTDIVCYFSNYNAKTQKDFLEVFGPNSCIYSNAPKVIKFRKKYFKIEPFKYRTSEHDSTIKDISFEFFQLFRMVDHQEKWALEILEAFRGKKDECEEYYKYSAKFVLYNFARLTAQINVFGISENLYKYKFLFHYHKFWYIAVDQKYDLEDINHFKQVEKYIVKCLFEYICKALNKPDNEEFIGMIEEILEDILLKDCYKGALDLSELILGICEVAYVKKNKYLQSSIEKKLTQYIDEKGKDTQLKGEYIVKYLRQLDEVEHSTRDKQLDIFGIA